MPKIFISYRREDSKHAVGRLHSALKRHVRNPKRDIFMDIDNIPRGVDFVEHLDGQVAQCDVMLAVIGPGWLSAKDSNTGKRRLDDPGDFVRIEVASALKRGIPVVPVVLDDTSIPAAADLPEDLKALARRNGERLDHESFDADVARLIKNLAGPKPKAVPTPSPVSTTPRRSDGNLLVGPVVALGLLASAGGAYAWFGNPGDWRGLGAQPASEVATDASVPVEVATAKPAPAVSTPSASLPAAGESFRDCSYCPEMVSIPAGSFMMGSPVSEAGRDDDEGPQRRVSVPTFAAGKYEVTWAEWDRCVAARACASLTGDGFGGGSRPVTNVSWYEAVTYTKWLSSKTGQTYLLLSESEWEYAARSGNSGRWSFGDNEGSLGSYAWHSKETGYETHAVGTKTANGFGLHDMHGNVSEWVEDCFEDNYSAGQPSDGRAYTSRSCSDRVNRGGSWYDPPERLRAAHRNGIDPTYRSKDLGFRVARTLSSTP